MVFFTYIMLINGIEISVYKPIFYILYIYALRRHFVSKALKTIILILLHINNSDRVTKRETFPGGTDISIRRFLYLQEKPPHLFSCLPNNIFNIKLTTIATHLRILTTINFF